jgi:DNA gyrase/topoisomerase IV subunit A
MIINKSGVAIRMGMDEMRVMGRNTGCKLINLKKNDEIAAIAKVEMDKDVEEDSEEIEDEEGAEGEFWKEGHYLITLKTKMKPQKRKMRILILKNKLYN